MDCPPKSSINFLITILPFSFSPLSINITMEAQCPLYPISSHVPYPLFHWNIHFVYRMLWKSFFIRLIIRSPTKSNGLFRKRKNICAIRFCHPEELRRFIYIPYLRRRKLPIHRRMAD